MLELGRLGHSVTLWLEDCEGRHAREPASVTKRSFAEFFGAAGLDLHVDFEGWSGADLVLGTGWQIRALLLPGATGRAYLVQDHEPEFYGASAERMFAETTYRQGLHCIAASEWLAELLRRRYGASVSHFDLAVDESTYHSTGAQRRDDLVAFYARGVTPRRAVPLGLLALEELARRRPALEIAVFGDDRGLHVPFKHTNLGLLDPAGLAQLYSRATIGMVFSLTNPSLVGLEMLACGLPCVELATPSILRTFGADGPLQLADPHPLRVSSAVEQLLDDPARREHMGRAGISFMDDRTWGKAVRQVERGLRAALGTTC
jgi:glycosyltransferase involved in cell wall biosynthesis